MSEENKTIFDAVAEKSVSDMVKENDAILNQLHGLEWALTQMAQDKQMTAAAWRRAIKGFHASRKKGELEKCNFEHPIEEAVAKNLRNQVGIAAMMATRMEGGIKATTAEMQRIQKKMQERAAELEKSVKVDYATQTDEVVKNEGEIK